MTRERATLWLIGGVALTTIALSINFLGSRFPDIREEAVFALGFAAIAVSGVFWVLVRRHKT